MQEAPGSLDKRGQILAALNHLDHVLPGQGPIHDFVHHNTIHGFQHLPFEKALEEFEALTGIFGYQAESKNRDLYQQGRITDEDITAALNHNKDLQADEVVCRLNGRTIARRDIYRAALLSDFEGISVSQLNWQIEELDAQHKAQPDVPDHARNELFANNAREADVIGQLWKSILNKLGLEQTALHPETLLDL